MDLVKQRSASHDSAEQSTDEVGQVGKRTLVMDLQRKMGPVHVQRAGGAPGAHDPEVVHEAAARGIATPASHLPYADEIQRTFGRHDISKVQAHVGGEAAASARAMNAEAYATGNHIAFASTPTLHTAAHEAAHIVQQRGGVQLKGGVGQVGDVYERHADEVADLVVAGKSAESALDRHAGNGCAAPSDHVQRFYRESDGEPPYEWVDNAEWDATKYELSGNQPAGWLFYRVYREKTDPAAIAKQERAARARELQWRRKLDTLRGTLADQERDPKKFNATTARAQIDAALDTALAGIPGDERAARIEEIRVYVDALPGYFGDHVVNAVHALVGKRGPQIGLPGVGYLAPSKTPDDQHIISRGISEVVLIEGQWYAPVYQTVYGDALGDATPKHKDAGQDTSGRVELHSGKDAGADNTYWVAIGRPLRQIKWMEKYAADGAPEPLIRSFLVPLDVANVISGGAVTEYGTSGLGKDLIVDKHYERNQFGIVDRASFDKVRQLALPGSLRTFTDGALTGRPESWGEVRPAAELRDRVGVPNKRIPGFDVFVDTAKKEFTSKSQYKNQVDTLASLHAFYTGNALFLPKGKSMPGKSERDKEVHDFFIAHKPGDLKDDAQGLQTFMTEYVAPWAAQAQVAEEISEDYEEISDPNRGRADLPTTPEAVHYGGKDAPPLRGQRRPEAMAMSAEQQRLLEARQTFLAGVKAASAKIRDVFADKPQPGQPVPQIQRTRNGLLGQLQNQLSRYTTSYDFYVGRTEAIARDLPGFRQEVADWANKLQNANLADPKVDELIVLLRTASA